MKFSYFFPKAYSYKKRHSDLSKKFEEFKKRSPGIPDFFDPTLKAELELNSDAILLLNSLGTNVLEELLKMTEEMIKLAELYKENNSAAFDKRIKESLGSS